VADSSTEFWLVAIEPPDKAGAALSRRILEADPVGPMMLEDRGEILVVLICREAIFGLIEVPMGSPEVARFRARLEESDGSRAVMVATLARAAPERICGFFECLLSSTPPGPPTPPGRGAASRSEGADSLAVRRSGEP
jgi:hypothetical protein